MILRKASRSAPIFPALSLAIMLAGNPCARAQDSLCTTDGFTMTSGTSPRKILAGGMAGGLIVGTMIGSYYEWWYRNHASFHFLHEGWFSDYALGIDKVGHMFTGYFYFNSVRNFMLWGGFSPSAAFFWAFGMSAMFATTIEIGDGFSSWGFSPEDVFSDYIGIGYGILQSQSPFLRNFNLKWSYVPDHGYIWPPHITDHYDFHTYWLAVNVHNLLPESVSGYWPEFLQLAVGYSVADNQTRREGVIGLDFNLNVFDLHDDTLLLLQKTASMIHVPAPAVKFSEGKYPAYYLFQLN